MHFPILAQITNTEHLRDSLAQAAKVVATTPTQDQLTVWDLISLGSFSPLLPPKAGLKAVVTYQGLPGSTPVSVQFK